MKDFKYYLETSGEVGFVEESLQSIAYASGLPKACLQEIILFETGETGMVLSLKKDQVEILVFSKYPVRVGTKVTRTNQIMQIPVGFSYIGRVIDPFGNLIDKIAPFIKPEEYTPIERNPTGINTRRRINKSFESGVTMVDMLVPLGFGQRELIIGDRKTGKTNFLLQTVLNQARLGVICIYAAIGKKRMDVKKAENFFIKNNIMNQVVLMASSSEDPVGNIYLTPYAAMSLAEYFRDQGKNVLLVLDDMFTHAKFYREISLLGRRFPGRNSYPADIFYSHARLMERAGNFITPQGEVSITCLPVIETIQGDLSGFIQTNLMSMTDGHIYFDIDLFTKGRRPSINPFLSVSRVGRQTQTPLKRSLQREIMSFLTLHETLESFSHFGAEATTSIKVTMAKGEKLFGFFEQGTNDVVSETLQIFLFALVWTGLWDQKPSMQLKTDIKIISERYKSDLKLQKQVQEIINKSMTLNDLLANLQKNYNDILTNIGFSELSGTQTTTTDKLGDEQKTAQTDMTKVTQITTN